MIDPGWIITGVSTVGVVVASFAAGVGLRQLHHLRTDSRERNRPMMAAELRKAPYTPGAQLLVIRNYGVSIARNVTVSFDPPVPEPPPEQAARSVTPLLIRRYAEPIPVITPGMELSNIWYSGQPDGHNGWQNAEPPPISSP